MSEKMDMALRLAKEGRQEGFRYLREHTQPGLMQKAMEVLHDEQAAGRAVEQAYDQVFSRIGEVAQAAQFEPWIADMTVYFANQIAAQPDNQQAQPGHQTVQQNNQQAQPDNQTMETNNRQAQPKDKKSGFLHTTGGKITLIAVILAVVGGVTAGIILHNKNKKENQQAKTEVTTEAVSEETEATSTEVTSTESTSTEALSETTTEEATIEESVDYASVYLAILQRESAAIGYYNQFRWTFGSDWTADYAETAPIAIADITGDDVPELILIRSQSMENNYVADLYVYTVENGNEKQLLYESGWDVQVAGGSTYALFQIEGDSALYAINGMSDDFREDNYYRFDVQANGNLIKTELMTRYTEPNEDYSDTISTCTVGGADVTEDVFQSELDALSEKVCSVLMYNYFPVDAGMEAAFMEAEQAYMTYDEAISYLNGLVADVQGSADGSAQVGADAQQAGQASATFPFSESQSFYFSSGVEGGTTFELYLPGTPVSTLPEVYVGWVYGLSEQTSLFGYNI